MTNELEKHFFSTFGIEPEEEKYCLWECRIPELEHVPCSKECKHQRHDIYYPQISDRILLELMELLMKQQATEFYYHNDEYLFSSKLLGSNRPICNRVKNLRELVLRTANCLGGFAPLKDKMIKRVRTLFEEQ